MAEMVLKTPPLQGELIAITIFPKGNIDQLEFPKGILEEFTAEYNLTKPLYSVESVSGPPNNRRYDIKCIVKDLIHDNIFVTRSRNERKIKDGEHDTARQILKLLNETYYFSEQERESNEKALTFVMSKEEPTILKIKLFKWTNCCEFCFLRGHTKFQCTGPIRNKKLLPKNEKNTINNDEFWEIPGTPIENSNVTQIINENWDTPETEKSQNDSWDSPEAFFD